MGEFYARGTTVIKVNGEISDPIPVKRGVRQGDPMSVHLFNAVIDWALESLDPMLGIRLGDGVHLNHLAFADDIGLLARTPVGAQSQIDSIADHLAKSGLEISAGPGGKSASLRIQIDGHKKKWVVNPNEHLQVCGQVIRALGIDGVYKYLGIPMSVKGAQSTLVGKLQEYLDNVTKAPLKPQQRLYI